MTQKTFFESFLLSDEQDLTSYVSLSKRGIYKKIKSEEEFEPIDFPDLTDENEEINEQKNILLSLPDDILDDGNFQNKIKNLDIIADKFKSIYEEKINDFHDNIKVKSSERVLDNLSQSTSFQNDSLSAQLSTTHIESNVNGSFESKNENFVSPKKEESIKSVNTKFDLTVLSYNSYSPNHENFNPIYNQEVTKLEGSMHEDKSSISFKENSSITTIPTSPKEKDNTILNLSNILSSTDEESHNISQLSTQDVKNFISSYENLKIEINSPNDIVNQISKEIVNDTVNIFEENSKEVKNDILNLDNSIEEGLLSNEERINNNKPIYDEYTTKLNGNYFNSSKKLDNSSIFEKNIPHVNFQSFHVSNQILLLLLALLKKDSIKTGEILDIPSDEKLQLELVRKAETLGYFPINLFSNIIKFIGLCTQPITSFWALRLNSLHFSKVNQEYSYKKDYSYYENSIRESFHWCFLHQSYFVFETLDGLPNIEDHIRVHSILEEKAKFKPHFSEEVKNDIEYLMGVDTFIMAQVQIFKQLRKFEPSQWNVLGINQKTIRVLEPYSKFSEIKWFDNGKILENSIQLRRSAYPLLPKKPSESWKNIIPRESKNVLFYVQIKNALLTKENIIDAPFVGYIGHAPKGIEAYIQERNLYEKLQHFENCFQDDSFTPYSFNISQELILDFLMLLTWSYDISNFSNLHMNLENIQCKIYLLRSEESDLNNDSRNLFFESEEKIENLLLKIIFDNKMSDYIHGINWISKPSQEKPGNLNSIKLSPPKIVENKEPTKMKEVSQVYSTLTPKDYISLLVKKGINDSQYFEQLYQYFCKQHGCKPNSAILASLREKTFCNDKGIIDLSRNLLGNKGIKPVIDCILMINECNVLRIQNNSLMNDGIEYICNQLKMNKNIKVIDLGGNEDLGLYAGKILYDFLKECTWIEELHVNNTCIPKQVKDDIQNLLWNRFRLRSYV